MSNVTLTDAELALLDGKVSPSVQATVDASKARLAAQRAMPDVDPRIAGFVADVVEEANKTKKVAFQYMQIRACRCCGKDAGYALRSRSSRHHRKRSPNYDRPLSIGGVELADRFISIQGYATLGCCRECWKIAEPLVKAALADVRAEVSSHITGHPPRYVRKQNKECVDCGWKGHEGEMGMLPALMGGEYPGECPSCKARNMLFGRDAVKSVNGYTVLDNPKFAEVPRDA